MDKYLIEVCCGSVEDVLEAERGGADRVELNSCLFRQRVSGLNAPAV